MSPGDLIATSVEHRGGVVVLVVEGEVDVSTAPVLRAAIDDVLAEEPSELVIDFSAVTFLASVGLQILVLTNERVSGRARFAVVASGPATSRPIRLTGLDSMFSLYESLDAGLTGGSSHAEDRG